MNLRIITLLAAAVSLMTATYARSATLQCQWNGEGYEVRNAASGLRVGTGHYFNLFLCQSAISSQVTSLGRNLVCAARAPGTGVYDADSGLARGPINYYWFDIENCRKSLTLTYNGHVCVPNGEGSQVYSLANETLLGPMSFYYDIKDCTWATWSARFNTPYVCASNGGGSSLFWKVGGALAYSTVWDTAEECARYLESLGARTPPTPAPVRIPPPPQEDPNGPKTWRVTYMAAAIDPRNPAWSCRSDILATIGTAARLRGAPVWHIQSRNIEDFDATLNVAQQVLSLSCVISVENVATGENVKKN